MELFSLIILFSFIEYHPFFFFCYNDFHHVLRMQLHFLFYWPEAFFSLSSLNPGAWSLHNGPCMGLVKLLEQMDYQYSIVDQWDGDPQIVLCCYIGVELPNLVLLMTEDAFSAAPSQGLLILSLPVSITSESSHLVMLHSLRLTSRGVSNCTTLYRLPHKSNIPPPHGDFKFVVSCWIAHKTEWPNVKKKNSRW